MAQEVAFGTTILLAGCHAAPRLDANAAAHTATWPCPCSTAWLLLLLLLCLWLLWLLLLRQLLLLLLLWWRLLCHRWSL
uniref:Putative secreted protein n=1 Tax=Ixodes ricinus TaxID=34613 RepID=A0A6B0U6V2_IXORI